MTTASMTSTPSSSQLAGIRILLVDDSPDGRLLVQRFLEMAGAKVETASHGKEGVDLAVNKDFDIVLMDLQMPVMDGYSATSHLRQLGFRTPIVALTAHAMKEDVERTLNSGFSDHVAKPVRRMDLYDRIQRLVGRSQPETPPH